MKKIVIQSGLFALFTIIWSLIIIPANAQTRATNPKVNAVIYLAERCPACHANNCKVNGRINARLKEFEVNVGS